MGKVVAGLARRCQYLLRDMVNAYLAHFASVQLLIPFRAVFALLRASTQPV